MLLSGPIAAAYRAAAEPERVFTRRLALLFGLLVVFGLGVDALHSAVSAVPFTSLLAVPEDGGELLAVSLICAVLYGMLNPGLTSHPSGQPCTRPEAGASAAAAPDA